MKLDKSIKKGKKPLTGLDLEDIPLKYLEREVIQWNFECRIDGQLFLQNLIIESKVSEQEKVLNDLGI